MELAGKIIKFLGKHTKMEDVKTGSTYAVIISYDDSFWKNIQKHLTTEMVDGQTNYDIDSLIVPNEIWDDFKNLKFNLIVYFTIGERKGNVDIYDKEYQVIIPNVVLHSNNQSSYKIYDDFAKELKKFQITIPYKTELKITELID